MVKLWIEYVCCCIEREFKIKISAKNALQLDSTTAVKFSQHLIFHLPNAAFRNNLECGYFVHKICNDLRQFLSSEKDESWVCNIPNSEKFDQLLVKNSDDSEVLFIDEGVYSKNRNFRMFMSSKVGKNVELKLSADCTFPFQPGTPCCIFHNTSTELQKKKKCYSGALQQTEESKAQLIFLASLITNIKSDQTINFLSLPDMNAEKLHCVKETNNNLTPKYFTNDSNCSSDSNSNIPFGELANFVTSLIQSRNPDGYVKNWTHFPSSNVILYNIDKSRYCFNVGREHKSNRVMYVAELSTLTCYQKCYDPVCRNADYRSDAISFPPDVIRMIKIDGENKCDIVSDSELIELAEQAETSAEINSVSDDEMIKFAETTTMTKETDCLSDGELCKAAVEMEAFHDESFTEEFFNA
uniref:DNA-directed primase/polymerase protein n=1 Tax=Phallusia mammillata TaxID=59560 RepID=A0A6F9DPP3_9ASCI|nr:DNA-directed primase/polymerase protein-like [Phallusia mammillata]